MKALLTTPPYMYLPVFPNFQQVISEAIEHSELYPPLGLHYIASYANKYSDHEVKVLDSYALHLDYDGIVKVVRDFKPDVVGITAVTLQWRDCVETAKVIKEIDKSIHICVGGPHANIYPDEILKLSLIDTVLMGEAEYSFVRLLDRLEAHPAYSDIEGNEILVSNGRYDLPVVKNLNLLPFPDRKSMQLDLYQTTFGKRELSSSIIGVRGCPYHCAFCANLYGHTCRFRSPENIVSELNECVDLGIKKLTFWDDTFTVNKKWVIEICREITKEDLDIHWECRGRVNTVDKELLEAMFKAGCDKIHYGIESGSQRLLDLMKKQITLEQSETAIGVSKDMGFKTYSNWMIGLPTETLAEMEQTISFSCRIKGLDFANFAVYYPLPNTEFYEMGMKQGFFDDYWRNHTLDPYKPFELRAWNYTTPIPVLMSKLNECFRKFYLRPNKILSILKTCETLDDLKIYTKAGWWLLKKKAEI